MMFVSSGTVIGIQYPSIEGETVAKKTRIREYNGLCAFKLLHQEDSLWDVR